MQGSWEKIIDRIHNTRKRSAVMSDASEHSPAKRGRPKINTVLSRYPPIRQDLDGDDEVSISRNIKALEKEMQKQHPRKEAILPLMKQTFPTRRQDVLLPSAEVSFSSLLTEYPALSLPYVVSDIVYI